MTLEEKLKEYQEKMKKNPLTSVIIITTLLLLLLITVPYAYISLRGINNATVEATLENQSRATLAQIFGGVAIGIGLYYTWRRISISEKELKAIQKNLAITQKNLRVAQENLKVSQESQITERFTRAIDQLGNHAMEIRLGGIYALERIANESEKDYWPIMEILTAYVRKNSWNALNQYYEMLEVKGTDQDPPNEVSLDIQSILTVIGRRKNFFNHGESNRLKLRKTYLRGADFQGAHLEETSLTEATVERSDFRGANLEGAYLLRTHLEDAYFMLADLEVAKLMGAHLEGANFYKANLHLASLNEANLQEARLQEAKNLTVSQLSKVKTLYNALLDEELEKPLREMSPALFEEPK